MSHTKSISSMTIIREVGLKIRDSIRVDLNRMIDQDRNLASIRNILDPKEAIIDNRDMFQGNL